MTRRRALRSVAVAAGLLLLLGIALDSPTVFAVLSVLALLPAWIARRKGRFAFGWWIAGALLWLPALVMACVVRSERRRCPACSSSIGAGDVACPSCGADVAADARAWASRPRENLYGFRVLTIITGSLVGFVLLVAVAAELA